jgi:hypothetical protein
VRVDLYSVEGRRVATLAEGEFPAGRHEIPWTPNVAPGVYFARLVLGGAPAGTARVVLAR